MELLFVLLFAYMRRVRDTQIKAALEKAADTKLGQDATGIVNAAADKAKHALPVLVK
jgi:hypothetical protein